MNSLTTKYNYRLVAREDAIRVNNAVMQFPANDPFIYSAMMMFVINFDGYKWFVLII